MVRRLPARSQAEQAAGRGLGLRLVASLSLSSQSASALDVDAVVIGVGCTSSNPETASDGTAAPAALVLAAGSQEIDSALGGRLLETLASLGAKGKSGEITRIATLGALSAPLVIAVGLGAADGSWSTETLRRAAGGAVRALAGHRRAALTLSQANGSSPADVQAVAEGALLGTYAFTEYRASVEREPVAEITLLDPGAEDAEVVEAARRAEVLAAAAALARDLVNTPPRDLFPQRFAEIATERGADAGVSVQVWDDAALRDGGFGGLTGVGQGSTRPPRLVRIAWEPEGAGRTLALIGKGITFDSGGLSLKPPGSMETMKSDMAGAAAAFTAVLAAANLELPIRVVGWLALAENMPSGSAIRPSDVLTIYGGKRVEVLNTDAEGRLVLADAIVRASEESPDVIVDIATLTGAQLVALGSRTAGLMGNDEALQDRIVAASKVTGEVVWPMPLPEELRRNLDSSVADIANVPTNGSRDGGMLTAAHFLSEFVPKGIPWAHLDIAGPSFHGGEAYGYVSKGGTAFPMRTLVQLAEDLAGRPLPSSAAR
jgi:leucyl aminopeptidase